MATLENIDYNQITVGQPTEGGCVYVSFDGGELPTDASVAMSTLTKFESAGDISENGFTISQSRSTTKYKDWGKKTVLQTIDEDEFQCKLEFLETSRPVVAKLHYGADNVTVGEDGTVSAIDAVSGVSVTVSLVIDELENGGYMRRTVVPKAQIDSIDDEVHQKGSLLVFGATFTALAASDGKAMHVYRAKPVAA